MSSITVMENGIIHLCDESYKFYHTCNHYSLDDIEIKLSKLKMKKFTNQQKENFEKLIFEKLPTYKNPFLIKRNFLNCLTLTFEIEFNPEYWNYFPSLHVKHEEKILWSHEYNPYLEEIKTENYNKGDRKFFYVTIDNFNEVVEKSKELISDLVSQIVNLNNLDNLREIWNDTTTKYNFK